MIITGNIQYHFVNMYVHMQIERKKHCLKRNKILIFINDSSLSFVQTIIFVLNIICFKSKLWATQT